LNGNTAHTASTSRTVMRTPSEMCATNGPDSSARWAAAKFNPPEGFIATANEMNLPSDFSVVERKIGYEWTDPSRATRIEEVLAASQILLLRMRWRCKTMNIP
jgi:Penicillin amidase